MGMECPVAWLPPVFIWQSDFKKATMQHMEYLEHFKDTVNCDQFHFLFVYVMAGK